MNACECGHEVANEDRMGGSGLKCNTRGCETVWVCHTICWVVAPTWFLYCLFSFTVGAWRKSKKISCWEPGVVEVANPRSVIVCNKFLSICFSEIQRNIPKWYIFPIKTWEITKFRRYRGRGGYRGWLRKKMWVYICFQRSASPLGAPPERASLWMTVPLSAWKSGPVRFFSLKWL